MTVGQRLKALRKEKGVTQTQAAKDNEMDRTLLSKYESDGVQANYETLNKLATYYGVTSDYILGRVNEPNLTETESEERFLISFSALKEWRDRIANGEVVDIPPDRIPHIVDALDKEILMIEAKLKEHK